MLLLLLLILDSLNLTTNSEFNYISIPWPFKFKEAFNSDNVATTIQ
jgi:hypothetical protein